MNKIFLKLNVLIKKSLICFSPLGLTIIVGFLSKSSKLSKILAKSSFPLIL